MKLKRLVEDFQVEEQIALAPGEGPFALYRLIKQSLGTREAVDAIAERWRLPRQSVSYAGLKDKHALTTQYVTIHGGPPRGQSQTSFRLEYVGQITEPVHPGHITANRFLVVVRNLGAQQVGQAESAIDAISRNGFANYFDNQRFGSLGESGEFIAKPWCLGDYERSLWLAMAEPNVHDRPAERHTKSNLREHWGDWRKCDALIGKSELSEVTAFLSRHPTDFRRAIAFFRQDLRSIWLAAYQSHLWNQVLATMIKRNCREDQLTWQSIGSRMLPFVMDLDEPQRLRLRDVILPLPSARLHLADGPLKEVYDQVLTSEGIELRQIRVKYPRDSFFSKGERSAVAFPGELQHEVTADDLYAGRQKLILRFTLPRGCYATIVVKRIFEGQGDELLDEG